MLLQLRVTSQNSLHGPFEGQDHLDSPCDNGQGFINGGKLFVKIMISLQISELWPKMGFWQVKHNNTF